MSTPETDLTDMPTNRLSMWQHIQKVKQHFWTRWHKEYLNELRNRTKWHANDANQIKVGTIVIVQEDNLPPMQWNLGRIINVHPGSDDVIRVATIKTKTGVYKRSVKKLCPLPLEEL